MPVPATASRPFVGVAMMLLAGVCFVGVIAVVKHAGIDLPPAEMAFLRYALGLALLVPMIRPMISDGLAPGTLRLAAFRGALHSVGVICWFYAMTVIPIAEVTAMNYLSPVYVTIGAALFLGERIAARRIAAVLVAMIGMLIILRPGLREVSTGHLAMLLAAILFAGSYLSAKSLAARMSPLSVVGWLSVTVVIGLAPFAAADWVAPSLALVGWMLLVAVFATVGHYFMTLSFRAAPMAVTQPVTFLQLVWSVLLGALVFGEGLDGWVILGGAVILGAVSFIAWREAMPKRRAITPPDGATKL